MEYENLYDSLKYNIPDEDLSFDEKQKLVDVIGSFDQEKKELIYTLILHDYIRTNPSTKVIFPYKCKQVENAIEIKVDALPIRLKRVLHRFCTITEQR